LPEACLSDDHVEFSWAEPMALPAAAPGGGKTSGNVQSLNDLTGALELKTTGGATITTDDAAEITISAGDGHSLDAADGDPVDALVVNNDGNVGIGTTSPAAQLHIREDKDGITQLVIENLSTGASSAERLSFNNEDGYLAFIQVNDAASAVPGIMTIGNSRPGGSIRLSTQGDPRLTVTNGGNVGIGTETPGELLTVDGIIQSTSGGFKFPDGTVQTGGGIAANGETSTTDGFAVTGALGVGDIPIEGGGVRMMWYPGKGAFRAGIACPGSPCWDDDNVGIGSAAVGQWTWAIGDYSTATGWQTQARGEGSTALGNGIASGDWSTVMGGGQASGLASTAIGFSTRATGDYSVAMGRLAGTGPNEGSFVYGDASTLQVVRSTRPNQFVVRAAGGTIIYSNSDLTAGVKLGPGAGAWASASDRNRKENFQEEDAESVLERIAAMPIQSWSYKSQEPSVRHIGPTAQDFYAAFHLGESDTTITTTDIDGVNMLAIQALERRTAEVSALRTEVAELRSLVEQLMRQSSTPRDEDR
jgi:hypothetical protein